MARIRTIKPEYWEDEIIASWSPWARLLFICCWNHADDTGVLPWSPAGLRAKAFPHDDHTLEAVQGFMDEIVSSGRITPYSVSGQGFAYVWNFRNHQKINRPSSAKYPQPPPDLVRATFSDTAVRPHARLTESSRQEGKGRDKTHAPAKPPQPTPRNELWNTLCAHFGTPTTASERSNRGRQVRELLAANASPKDIDARVAEHRRRRPGWTLTANSLITHWTELTPRVAPVRTMNGAVLDDRVAL